ncbi:ankyrin repeat domain-containing protein [Halobacterium salinarum]|uniref:ankyrin repeat domain-containing protein n=1 Tax=Halobacterium salinarum TaxID=2242 RepID=UPI0025521A05|nr:ankyrin repeat domain-containing protein [Halobacterium salinarum]MDL0124464.1 ankyrin repeat domain-containing protein [Halobacterium salinarum]
MTDKYPDDIYYRTDLESAIVQGNETVFSELIDDAGLAHRSGSGGTLLHTAQTGNRTSMAMELIERGIDINATDEGGYTALHRALDKQRWEFVELLIEHGADVNTTNVSGSTPLHSVIGHARLNNKFVKLLLEHGADPTLSGDSGKSPLEIARDLEYDDIVELLEGPTERQRFVSCWFAPESQHAPIYV